MTAIEAGRVIDRAAAERSAADLLRALGANLDHEQLRETPRRMIDAYAELLTPQAFRATTFPNDDGYDELVLVRAIPFHSLCMSVRGVQKFGATTITSALRGLIRDDPRTRQEFLTLTTRSGT